MSNNEQEPYGAEFRRLMSARTAAPPTSFPSLTALGRKASHVSSAGLRRLAAAAVVIGLVNVLAIANFQPETTAAETEDAVTLVYDFDFEY